MSDAGKVRPSEMREYKDPATGARVRQLTNYRAHSHHLYFTNPGWYDSNRRLLFGSDRGNRKNLYSLELDSGQITQLTDFVPAGDVTQGASFLSASLNPARPEAYFWWAGELHALDLRSLALRSLWRVPDGFRNGQTSVTADGKYVCTVVSEDLSDRVRMDMNHGYVGFREYHLAKPLCRIMEAPTDGGATRVLFEERYWVGHVNPSPTQAHLLTYCHEGPWELVDCRIWGLDRNTGRNWRIRPTGPDECVGHEYWLADGVTIGYHGRPKGDDKNALFGFIRYDNSGCVEAPFPRGAMHFHSNTRDLIAGDGWPHDPWIYLWRFAGGSFSAARQLCHHRGSFHIQEVHPHPRFSPEGKYVLFTADPAGYGNLYAADVTERMKDEG